MEQCETTSPENDDELIEKEISELIEEQRLFTESIYACLPVGIEIYDAHGVLRSINDHALKMYGVDDRNSVVNIVNVYKSPFVDAELLARIRSGEDITLELEYDFDRVNKDAYYSSHNKDTMIYEVKIIPIWSKSRHLIGHILLANDMTSEKEVEFRTEESKKNLEMAMKAANMASWVYDVSKNVFNPLYGQTVARQDMPMEEILDILHPLDRTPLTRLFSQLIDNEVEQGQMTLRFYNEQEKMYRYYESRMRLSSEHRGKLQIIGTQMDITEKLQMTKKAQDLTAKRELAMKVSNIVHWDFDVRTQTFESYNDPINDYRSEKTITPEDYLNATHPNDVDYVRRYMEHMFRGIDKDFNVKYRSKTKWDDEWQTLLVTGIQVERDKEGHVIRYTGITINNTKWEKMIQQLKELKEKAELSDRLKSAFLANMSHEIRTPLNAIVGFSELMVTCNDPGEKEEYINIIQSNNELLLRLINDILDLSKIESGIIERRKENFNLTKVCSELFTTIRAKMTNLNVELRLDDSNPDCWVLLDRNRLKQVWMNFLTNAIKYTRSGYIRMGYSVENEGIRFYVEDTGAGIPKDLQDRVFGRFQKLNEFVQGTGLGLAISRAIIEAADGEIGFISEQGIGSTFWAWIPCEIFQHGDVGCPETSLSSRCPVLSEGGDRKLKILVAEDNDSNFLLVRNILKDYDLLRVTNGVEAVEEIRNGRFDFVLMDLKMPVMDGLVATRKIREFNSDIPIVALTANAFDADRASAMDAGCNAFLSKPVKQKQLFELLSGACR